MQASTGTGLDGATGGAAIASTVGEILEHQDQGSKAADVWCVNYVLSMK